jgi:pimeloyl-ACP methyl ester carboxylesterase
MPDTLDRLRAALADRYTIQRELGRGGMATVYLAEDRKHHRPVALKVVRPELAAALGPDRFLREIELSARLTHPHILPLHDSGNADGFLYYVMPYVEGESLRDRLNREKQLAVDDALQITREVADALSYAHSRGVVHRDVKPENILLQSGHAVVADFGIARAIDQAGGERLTETGLAIGTPAYMSPEQAAGSTDLDGRSDLYSLGCVLYEMLAGQPPFTGPTVESLVHQHLAAEPSRITGIRPAVPLHVAATLERALAKTPADRFATGHQLAVALDPVLPRPVAAQPAPPRRHALVEHHLPLTTEVCRQLDRAELDPRLIGDRLLYCDNHVESDVLVCYLHGFGGDHHALADVLAESPYRGVAPTMYGFERTRTTPRNALSLRDHVTLLRHFLRHVIREIRPETAVLVGFSSGGDVWFHLLSTWPVTEPLAVDAFLALGTNLSRETCFVSGALAQQSSSDETGLLTELRKAGVTASTLAHWLDTHEYLVTILRKFHANLDPLRRHAQDIVRPFLEPESPFAGWYREVSGRVKLLRCVFADTSMEAEPARRFLVAHLDTGILGRHYRENTIVIEPGTGHFDLSRAEVVRRHVDEMVEALKQSAP